MRQFPTIAPSIKDESPRGIASRKLDTKGRKCRPSRQNSDNRPACDGKKSRCTHHISRKLPYQMQPLTVNMRKTERNFHELLRRAVRSRHPGRTTSISASAGCFRRGRLTTSNETQDQRRRTRANVARSGSVEAISKESAGRSAVRCIAWLGGGVARRSDVEQKSGRTEGIELTTDMETELWKKTRQNSRREAEEATEREVRIPAAPPPRERPATHELGWSQEAHKRPNRTRSSPTNDVTRPFAHET